MHAVFFMSEYSKYDKAGLEDCRVYLFDSEQQAYDFAFEKMVEAGDIDGEDAQADTPDKRQEAVSEVQNSTGMLEFFHVYPVVDCRESMTRAAANV